MKIVQIICFIVVSLTFVGCEPLDKLMNGGGASVGYVDELHDINNQKIADLNRVLEERCRILEDEISLLDESLNKLRSKFNNSNLDNIIDIYELKRACLPQSVCFNLKERGGYQMVNSTSGSFMVSVKDVVPYLDGYKVLLSIGNPFAVDFESVSVKIEIYPKEIVEGWRELIKTKIYPVNKPLKGNTWNKIEIILTASIEELESVYFSFDDIGSVVMNTGT